MLQSWFKNLKTALLCSYILNAAGQILKNITLSLIQYWAGKHSVN